MAAGLKIVDGDIVIQSSGMIETTSGSRKCLRDFAKMVTTKSEFASNESSTYTSSINEASSVSTRYNPSYGTELDNFALYRGLSRAAARDMVIMKLNEAIDNYLRLQESRTNLELGEIISYVNFDVVYDTSDMRRLLIIYTIIRIIL
jgi:hypothetical protein